MERILEERVLKTLEEKGVAIKGIKAINIEGKEMLVVSVDTSVNKFEEALEGLGRIREVDCTIDRKGDKLFIVFREGEEEEMTEGTEEGPKNILERLGIPMIS